MSYVSHIFFKLHFIGMHLVPISWIITPYAIPLYLIIILSWFINNNNCIITQLEYLLFGSTFMGNNKNFQVPQKHRFILYINFILGIIYYLIIKLLYFIL